MDPAPPFDLAETDRLLSTTRSVRRRLDLDRPVDPATIIDCLRLAVQAPTASNTQNWRWMVVTDPAKRAALAQIYSDAGRSYLQERAAVADQDPQSARVYRSALYLTEILADVPVHVIPCIEGRPEESHGPAFYGSIIPAAWSFMLALRSRGLGAAWTTLHLLKAREANELLGIPSGITQVALLPVAWTIGTDFKPADRPPVEQITYWDTWGASGSGGEGR